MTLSGQVLLDPNSQPKFVHPLPDPPVLDVTGGETYAMSITEFMQDLGLRGAAGEVLMTRVWGYNGTYPGPTIVARKNVPVQFFWYNNLTDNYGRPLPHLLPVDASVHWALEHEAHWESAGIPIVTHLHGGHTESASDGLPEAWYTPGFAHKGKGFVKGDVVPYRYDNDQEAATLWYHDHALGITRLNVYAGLAGFYLLKDDTEDALVATLKLPAAPYDKGIVIQDRMFTEDGQLYFPSEPEEHGAPDPSVLPEFFGDFILVNGKTWPVLEVEPRTYRFRLLNGSDSRFYDLFLSSGQSFVQVGTDNGLLFSPVRRNHIVIAPGERVDVTVDFSNPALWGKTIILKNNARTPFPDGDDHPDRKTTGEIMAFRVSLPFNPAYPQTAVSAELRRPIRPLVQTGATRRLILFEGEDEYGRLKPMLGTIDAGILAWDAPITENPMLNDVEVWEVYNLTEDAHPIHLHLVSFQILSRQRFTGVVDPETAALSNIRLRGAPMRAPAWERGWKDTAPMFPGEVTRVIAKFDREGLYVWHCHILSHEDHEMMRPYYVGQMPDYQPLVSVQAAPGAAVGLEQNYPNPFQGQTSIRFHLPEAGKVSLMLYDALGREVQTLVDDYLDKGIHEVVVDAQRLQPGVYAYILSTGTETITKQMTVQ